jgi:hypothetical protein
VPRKFVTQHILLVPQRRPNHRSGRLAGKSLVDIKKEVRMPEYAGWGSQDRFPTNIEAAYKSPAWARVTDTGAKSFVLVVRYPGSSSPSPRALGAYAGGLKGHDAGPRGASGSH